MSRLEALKELSDRNIKALKEGRVISSAVHPNDLVFLVQQAERFEILAEQHDRVLAENQRYKQALEFYASAYKYTQPVEPNSIMSIIDMDSGLRARKALEGDSNG